jgi:hypothetical protein
LRINRPIATADMSKDEPENVASRGIPPCGYEHLMSPAIAFPGMRLQLQTQQNKPLAVEYYQLVRDLFNAPPISIGIQRYCFQLVGFIKIFAELNSGTSSEEDSRFAVIDLTDYCDGLPSDPRILGTLKRIYAEHSSVRAKIASAECIGRLRTGLAHAGELFIALLSIDDYKTRKSVIEAIDRTCSIQIRLAEDAAHCSENHHNLYLETRRQVGEFKARISELAESDRALFDGFGPLPEGDLAMFYLKRDEEYFQAQKDMFLRQHKNEFVAIRDGKVVGFAKNRESVEELVDREVGPDKRAFIEQITPEAFETKPWASVFIS